MKTDIQDERASRAKFEKAVGQEAVDAAMRIRDRLTGPPSGPRAAYLCHGFCELGTVPALDHARGRAGLPGREPGRGPGLRDRGLRRRRQDIEAAFRESGLERFVYRGGVTPPFPTLREMIDSDQRLVVFGEKDARASPGTTPPSRRSRRRPTRSTRRRSSRAGRTAAARRRLLFQINHWIETTPTPKPSNAAIVNAHDFLLARARQCQKERGRLPNILAVDFAMTGDVVGVAAELNDLAPADAVR